MLRVTVSADPLAREDLAFALSVILLGLLMMVTRRNAVSQIVGFMSLENGLILAATGARACPSSSSQHRLFCARRVHRDRRVSFSASASGSTPSTFRRSTNFAGRSTMIADFVAALPFRPVVAALAIPASPRSCSHSCRAIGSRRDQCVGCFPYALARVTLLFARPPSTTYLFVDDLNIVFVVLGAFVGFTTSVFSASYIGHEIDTAASRTPICVSITRCIRR